MSSISDVVVIGSGINGLVVTAELALAGRSVTLIEANPEIGGFIESGERTAPGFIHDTFSSWHPLFVSGAAYGALGDELHARGLVYDNTDGPVTAGAGPDGRVAVAHRDIDATLAAFEHPEDKDAYLGMLGDLEARAGTIFGALGTELDPSSMARLAMRTLGSQRAAGTEALVRDGLSSGRSYLDSRFDGWETDRLWSPWLLHAGLGPDSATGGVMLPVMAGTMHQFGLPVVRGGAKKFIDAFTALFDDHGVAVVRSTPVTEIVMRDGVAAGVRTADDEWLARDAVVAGVTPQALYNELLPRDMVPPKVFEQARGYRYGRAAMQIHLALDRPVAWSDERLREVPLIHVTEGASTIGIACAQAQAGVLPDQPTIVVGAQSLLDPSRAPDGAATLWIQLQELPFAPVADSAGEISTTGTWTSAVAEAYADRVLERIAALAPDLTSTIVARNIISPTDLAGHNANAVNGDPYCGSAELDQNLRWRPITSQGRHRTGIDHLWHIGASTHPGPGLGGGSGHLVAQQLLAPRSRNPIARFFS